MSNILIVCGPTATGKTDLALELAAKFNGELISADSRQVYTGMDIVTGKDIPPHFQKLTSTLIWRGRPLVYYSDRQTRIWLTDMIQPNEIFNVSFFYEAATQVIADIISRGKLPIVVGVTGLYIKSLTHPLNRIHIPPNQSLRNSLITKTSSQLFDYLNRLDPDYANALNHSDRANPRRLFRAIEIAQSSLTPPAHPVYSHLSLCLSSSLEHGYARIDRRVLTRLAAGAEAEVRHLLSQSYSWDLPSLHTSGYWVWKNYLSGLSSLPQLIQTWQSAEHHDFRQQLNWFKKQTQLHWYDIESSDFPTTAIQEVDNWYNSL